MPQRKLHPDRTRVSAESVSFQEYDLMVDYCVAEGFSPDQCQAAANTFTIDAAATADAMAAEGRVSNQLTELAADPLAAPVHLEYWALLALLVVLSVDVLDVGNTLAHA